jgi:hypothetical protein
MTAADLSEEPLNVVQGCKVANQPPPLGEIGHGPSSRICPVQRVPPDGELGLQRSKLLFGIDRLIHDNPRTIAATIEDRRTAD